MVNDNHNPAGAYYSGSSSSSSRSKVAGGNNFNFNDYWTSDFGGTGNYNLPSSEEMNNALSKTLNNLSVMTNGKNYSVNWNSFMNWYQSPAGRTVDYDYWYYVENQGGTPIYMPDPDPDNYDAQVEGYMQGYNYRRTK